MFIDLSDQVVFITGASHGIGRAIAAEFARSGADTALAGRDRRALQETASIVTEAKCRASLHTIDLTQQHAPSTLVQQVMLQWGRIDVLVNNAGIAYSEDAVDSQAQETWELTRDLNLDAAYILSRLVGTEMVKRRQGVQINIGSIGGARALPGHEIAYSTTKAALDGLTRSLADTLAPFGVRVNTIAPGYIATAMNEEARRDLTYVEAIEGRTPLGRFGTPEEVAYVAVFLASSQAGYITGQTIYVDGGWTIR